jgi:poly-gamma-glutamate synthesis protein (capsule biosynthesis protein)
MISRRFLPLLIVIFVLTSLSAIYISHSRFKIYAPLKELNSEVELIPTIPLESKPSSKISETITIEKIFDGIDSSEDPDNWSLLVGGDVMIGRTVNYKALTYGNFDWPYNNLKDLFSKSDYSFVNLESPVTESCPIKNDGMIFCGKVNHIQSMAKAGIKAASLANNHMLNQGEDGLKTTLDYLKQNNIAAVGVENPTYIETNGQKVALLAYSDIECYPGIACVDYEKIKSDLTTAKNNSDLVVVMYHWGTEYQDYPNSRQIEIAHLSIDSGADLVLGNHPHWIQPFEIYKDKLIMYSHGNLVFDQMWSQKTREGLLVEYIFNKNNLVDANLHPILIEDFGQPRVLEGQEKSDKIEFVKEVTENLSKGDY